MNIYIYGDSNTWGYIPTLNAYCGDDNLTPRYEENKRWWYSLKDYIVDVNGINGRTVNNDHPTLEKRNAIKTFYNDVIIENINLVIIMLGTNDLKDCYKLKVDDIVINLDKLAKMFIKQYKSKIMLICPPLIFNTIVTEEKYSNGIEKIEELDSKLKEYCKKENYLFASAISCEVGVDGEHLTEEGHKKLGEIVLTTLKSEHII